MEKSRTKEHKEYKEYEEHQTKFGRVGMISKKEEVAGYLTWFWCSSYSFVFLIFSQSPVTSWSKEWVKEVTGSCEKIKNQHRLKPVPPCSL